MPPDNPRVGEQLVAAGWRQGSLLPANAPVLFVEGFLGPPVRWEERRRDLEGMLVLASQTCDVKRHPSEEPIVEFLRAFWTANQRIVVPAGKNSVRHFLLREREQNGERQGLIAEAARRVFVEKRSLLLFNPEPGVEPARERHFRRWLARRYDRPAIADAIVSAIQKPVVEALRAAPVEARIWALLRGVREVLFDTAERAAPFKVNLLFVRDDALVDSQPLTEADAEELAAWFSEAIRAAGEAELDDWDAATSDQISIRDYLTFTPLPLDEYSQ